MLDEVFAKCPWPVPPSSILLHIPIKEQKPTRTNEAILHDVITRDRNWRNFGNWEFRNVLRPKWTKDKNADCCGWTYWDDGTKAKYRPRRHYAFRKGVAPVVSENKWIEFLNRWTPEELGTATGLVQAGVYSDLNESQRHLLQILRTNYADVLLLKSDDPLHVYQTRLRTLWGYGMLNLSLPSNTPLSQLKRQLRSVTAQLRESKKRTARWKQSAKRHSDRADVAEAKLRAQEAILRKAKAQLQAFRTTHPDWQPPPGEFLLPQQNEDAEDIFRIVDNDLDLELQMKHDPSGCLATFWQEQKRQLHTPKKKGRRWNPQVVWVDCSSG